MHLNANELKVLLVFVTRVPKLCVNVTLTLSLVRYVVRIFHGKESEFSFMA